MLARSQEYADYREWWKKDHSSSAKGTLLWEAGKHVLEPIGQNKSFFALTAFATATLRKISPITELLVGRGK
jgi:hypothetical protein